MAQKYPYIDDTHNPSSNPFHSLLNDYDQFGVSASSDFHISGISTFSGEVNISGSLNVASGLKDTSGDLGNSGQILASTGSGINWIDANTTNVNSASNVGTNLNSTDASQFIAFLGANNGNNPVRVDSDLTYNPSTNVLSVKGITLPGDDQKITIGADDPLEIKHDSTSGQVNLKSDANISIMSGDRVQIEDDSGGNIADFIKASGCKLYHNVSGTSTLRLETNTAGVNATGELETDTLKVTGNSALQGDVDLGTDANNTITFNGDIDSALIPVNPDAHSLGALGAEWSNLWVNDINVAGFIKDKDGDTGTSGQVLSSTGTQVNWINVGNIAAGSASQVALSDDSNSDNARFIVFADSASGNNSLKTDAGLKYNPSTNVIASQITDVSNHTSDDISEGSTNLYYTNTRARASISVSGDLSYNNSTGVLSYSPTFTFTGLTDTPANYTSQADKWIKVKSDASGLEFTDAPAGSFTGLTDTPANYSGHGTKLLAVKSDASGLEYVAAGTGADVDTFLELTDTPGTFIASKFVKVNSAGTGLEFGDDNDTTYSVVTASDDGLAPHLPGAHGGKFLKADASWEVPPDTTYTLPAGGTDGTNYTDAKGSATIVLTDNAGTPNTDTVTITAGTNIKIDSTGVSGFTINAQDTNTTYSLFTTSADGLAPSLPAAHGGKFLKADGSWEVPAYTTDTWRGIDTAPASGATTDSISSSWAYTHASSEGNSGHVPSVGSAGQFLKHDGTWGIPPNTTYSLFTTSAAGLAPQLLSTHGGKFLRADGSWVVPPDTTYSNFAGTTAGLVPTSTSSETTKFLRSDGSWQTVAVTESDTLADVTGRGSSTTTSCTFQNDFTVKANNKMFKVQNASGTNKFTVDTDNGSTSIIGTGTPTIESPSGGNLNITAATTALSGNLTVGGTGTPTIASPSGGNLNVTAATATFSQNVHVTGNLTVTGTSPGGDIVNDLTPQLGGNLDTNSKNIVFGSTTGSTADRLTFGGSSPKMAIYHDGTTGSINCTTGSLTTRVHDSNGKGFIIEDPNSGTAQVIAKFEKDATNGKGRCELMHGGAKVFETVSGGVTITGDLSVTGSYPGGSGGGGDNISENDTKAEVVDTASESYFKVDIDGTERFRIQSGTAKNGNVLLKRTVVNGVTEGGHLQFEDSQAVESFAIDVYGSTSANSILRILDQTTGVQRFCVNRSGALGIGNVGSEDYGTTDEVLISQGDATPPKWDSLGAITVSTAESTDDNNWYNIPFLTTTGAGGGQRGLQVDNAGLMFNPYLNQFSVQFMQLGSANYNTNQYAQGAILVLDNAGNAFGEINGIAFGYGNNRNSTAQTNVVIGQTTTGTDIGGLSVAIGYGAYSSTTGAGAQYNVALGYQALMGATGAQNIGIGDNALSGTGNYNIGIGRRAGTSMSGGQLNIFMGYEAATSATTIRHSIALGYNALDSIQGGLMPGASGTGNDYGHIAIGYNSQKEFLGVDSQGAPNIAMGIFSLENNVQSGANIAIGNAALQYLGKDMTSTNNTGGYGNIAVGTAALRGSHTGSYSSNTFRGDYNVAVGWNALASVAGHDCDTNTAIGVQAGQYVSTGDNNVLLGSVAGTNGSPSGQITTGSNIVCLGNNSISALYCADTSISSSDARDKTDVEDFKYGLSWIKELRPITYRWDKRTWYGTEEEPFGTPDGSKKRDRLHIGFLAQEAIEVEKKHGYASKKDDMLIVNQDEDEENPSYGYKYERLVPVLVNAIKELSAKNDALEARLEALES